MVGSVHLRTKKKPTPKVHAKPIDFIDLGFGESAARLRALAATADGRRKLSGIEKLGKHRLAPIARALLKRNSGVRLTIGSSAAELKGYHDGSVRVINSDFFVVNKVTSPGVRRMILREAHRVLVPNGFLTLTFSKRHIEATLAELKSLGFRDQDIVVRPIGKTDFLTASTRRFLQLSKKSGNEHLTPYRLTAIKQTDA